MALGAELKEARMRMDLTASEVASATRMKVQIVEAIEDDDYSVFAAPIYGKGFIRLYAEYVGLDARPLVEEFTENFSAGGSPRPRPQMRARETPPEPGPPMSEPEAVPDPTPEPSPEPASEPRKPKRSPGGARAGRQFDLFNDLPEDEPEDAAPEPSAAAAKQDPDPLILPLEETDREDVAPQLADPPDPSPEPIEDVPVDEPVREVSEASPAEAPVLAPEPAFDSPAPPSEDENDLAAAPEGSPLSTWRDRIDNLFRGSREGGQREGLQMPHLVIGGVGIIVILAFIISGVSQCGRDPGTTASGNGTPDRGDAMVLGIDMPEPYFD